MSTTSSFTNSRSNSLKHGLTGAGTVLPPDIRATVDARYRQWSPLFRLDADPRAPLLVFQHVLASVRMELCQSALMDLLPAQSAADLVDFDEQQSQAANLRFNSLAADPVATVADLRQSSAGCERLALAWSALAVPLAHPEAFAWTPADQSRAYDLLGIAPADRPFDPRGSILYALVARITDSRSTPEAKSQARADLRSWVADQIESLRTRAQSLRSTTESSRRSLLAAGHTFTPSAEARRLIRYEAMATRQFWKTDKLLRDLNLHRPAPPASERPAHDATRHHPSQATPRASAHQTQPAGPEPTLPSPSPEPPTQPIRFAPALKPDSLPLESMSRHQRRRARKLLQGSRASH
jgi:hypothetical protein